MIDLRDLLTLPPTMEEVDESFLYIQRKIHMDRIFNDPSDPPDKRYVILARICVDWARMHARQKKETSK